MKKTWLIVLTTILSAMVLISGCKNDDKNDARPEVKDIKKLTIGKADSDKIVPVPAALQKATDPMAKQCLGYIDMANKMKNYLTFFEPPQGAQLVSKKAKLKDINTVVTYTWTANDGMGNNATFWLTYEETDSKYVYVLEMEIPGVPRTKYMRAEQSKDGYEGTIEIFFDAFYKDLKYEWKANWNYDSKNIFTYTLKASIEGQSTDMVIVVNPDGSGNVEYSLNSIPLYLLEWKVDGSGTWVMYDGNGSVIQSGNWSA